MIRPILTTIATAAAFWDAWRWYVMRTAAAPEEAIALVVMAALLLVVAAMHVSQQRMLHDVPVVPIIALLLGYAGSYLVAPPILRAAIAVITLLLCVHIAVWGRRPPLALWGLSLLALPVLPSLQFYLGYPLRLICAALAVVLLQANGLAVSQQGTFLVWGGEMLQFDAPCSGVNMLWAGLLLALAMSFIHGFRPARLAVAVLVSVGLNIVFNVLRAGSLFYLEAGLFPAHAAWWHEGVGTVAFALAAIGTIMALRTLHVWRPQ